MTIEEFNNNYRISIQVSALQSAALAPKTSDGEPAIAYGSIDEIMNTVDMAVYDKETHEEVLLYDGDNEEQFLEEVYKEFNIKE